MRNAEREKWELVLKHPLSTPEQKQQAKIALGLEPDPKKAERDYRGAFDDALEACLLHGLPPEWDEGALDPRIADWHAEIHCVFLGSDPNKAPVAVPRLIQCITNSRSHLVIDRAVGALTGYMGLCWPRLTDEVREEAKQAVSRVFETLKPPTKERWLAWKDGCESAQKLCGEG